ncbi:MAG: hypothetical protein LBC20_03910 [Planctomycetaceae bacterium]|jgi:hypothetical protein|nr:hypothetical protein [Planctomycetaceae bacterium]
MKKLPIGTQWDNLQTTPIKITVPEKGCTITIEITGNKTLIVNYLFYQPKCSWRVLFYNRLFSFVPHRGDIININPYNIISLRLQGYDDAVRFVRRLLPVYALLHPAFMNIVTIRRVDTENRQLQ